MFMLKRYAHIYADTRITASAIYLPAAASEAYISETIQMFCAAPRLLPYDVRWNAIITLHTSSAFYPSLCLLTCCIDVLS